MIISSVLFDIVLFGGLLIAAVLDAAVPALSGAAILIAVAAAVYVAAGELAHRLGKHGQWTQEALSTGVALSVLFFIYYWWRNASDLSLLTLSVVLMMTSLMLTIAIIGCINAMWSQKKLNPLAGFVMTAVGGIILGAVAAPLTLGIGVGFKVLAVVIGGVIWKARERFSPSPEKDAQVEPPGILAGERWVLLPRAGTVLDRLVPVLVFGALLMVAAYQLGQSSPLPGTPGLASPATPRQP